MKCVMHIAVVCSLALSACPGLRSKSQEQLQDPKALSAERSEWQRWEQYDPRRNHFGGSGYPRGPARCVVTAAEVDVRQYHPAHFTSRPDDEFFPDRNPVVCGLLAGDRVYRVGTFEDQFVERHIQVSEVPFGECQGVVPAQAVNCAPMSPEDATLFKNATWGWWWKVKGVRLR